MGYQWDYIRHNTGGGTVTNTIYIGSQHNPEDRITMQVSDDDYKRVLSMVGCKGVQIVVTDLVTGNDQYIKTASCGCDECFCAIAFA